MSITVNDLKSLIREVLEENKKKVVINESGLTRVINIARGAVPSIKSVGIMTAQNPNGQQATPKFNREANKKLEADISKYGFMKIEGKFDVEEKSYLINNISREDLIALGKKYGQVSVIYGAIQQKEPDKKNNEDEDENKHFVFEYIESETGSVGDTREVILTSDQVQNQTNFYSMINGRKFIIPFFDPNYNMKVPTQGGRTIGNKP